MKKIRKLVVFDLEAKFQLFQKPAAQNEMVWLIQVGVGRMAGPLGAIWKMVKKSLQSWVKHQGIGEKRPHPKGELKELIVKGESKLWR